MVSRPPSTVLARAGSLPAASVPDAATVVLAAHDGYAVQAAMGAHGGKLMTPAALAESIVGPLTEQVAPERRTAALR